MKARRRHQPPFAVSSSSSSQSPPRYRASSSSCRPKPPPTTHKVQPSYPLIACERVTYQKCSQGAGHNRIDVTEQYKVHSASTEVFKADPKRRCASMRPRVQFLDDHTVSIATGARIGSGHKQASQDPVIRSASLDPQWGRRRLSSDELEIDHGRCPQRSQMTFDPAPPYPNTADLHSILHVDSNLAERSQSIASSSRNAESPRKFFFVHLVQDGR